MGISDRIEGFIAELLKDEEDWVEIGRNELASIFNCVPSQINYVIKTRFSPQRGYIVESKRGGGGCLRIRRVTIVDQMAHAISAIGDSIDFADAKAIVNYLYSEERISKEVGETILSGISDKSLVYAGADKNRLRAECLKNMLLANI